MKGKKGVNGSPGHPGKPGRTGLTGQTAKKIFKYKVSFRGLVPYVYSAEFTNPLTRFNYSEDGKTPIELNFG